MAVDVKDFIMNAIHEGIEEAPKIYMQNLENRLQTDVKIEESGSAVDYLQNMITEAEAKVSEFQEA